MHPLPQTVSERIPALERNPALERDPPVDSGKTVAPAPDPLDRSLHAGMARSTGGLSPAALALAFIDWAMHLAASPGRGLQLAKMAMLASIGSPTMPAVAAPAAIHRHDASSRSRTTTVSWRRDGSSSPSM